MNDERLIPFFGGLIVGGVSGAAIENKKNYTYGNQPVYYGNPYYQTPMYPNATYPQPIYTQPYSTPLTNNPVATTIPLTRNVASFESLAIVPIYKPYSKIKSQ